VSDIARHAAAYFQRELKDLTAAIRVGREHLAANPGDDETRASTTELERQRQELVDGWERSSVRRHVENRADESSVLAGSEKRAAAVEPTTSHGLSNERASDTSSTKTAVRLEGYAAVFNKWTDLGYFRERLAPGAFANAIKGSDCRCLFNHDANFIYGRTRANTLELAEDRIGLKFVCYLIPFDAASYGLARRIDRLDISGCSFSFYVKKDSWTFARHPGDLDERTIEEIAELFDVGPVTYPAYPQTSVHAVFETVQRATSPAAKHANTDEFGDNVAERPIPAWRQRVLDLRLKHIEDELHEWEANHVEGLLADLDRRRAVERKRQAHLALHPEDKDRIDIPGGLLLAGRG